MIIYIQKIYKKTKNRRHMKKIHVIATSEKRVITVACATDIPELLKENESIQGEWFYKNPNQLKEFLDEYPDKLEYFLKGFSYWIMFKVKGHNEHQGRYGKLKREIQKFSEDLFKKIRGLASRIAKEVRKVLKPKRAMYDEERKQKKIYRASSSYQIPYTKKNKTMVYG